MPQQRQDGGVFGLFALVAGIIASLKLTAKEKWEDYRQLSQEEGRVALTSTHNYRDGDDDSGTGDAEERGSLLDTSLPARARRIRQKTDCRTCFGMNGSLFWKALGVIVGLLVLWNAVKLIFRAVTPSPPNGLEGMPAYSSSLGCLDVPHIFNGSMVTFETGMSKDGDGALVIRGDSVGTITIYKAPPEQHTIRYEMTLRTDDKSLLDQVQIHEIDGEDSSRLLLATPEASKGSAACSRFDMKLFIPSTLSKYRLAGHTATHIRFDDEHNINLKLLYITLFDVSGQSQILPHNKVHATEMKLQMSSGWLVGDLSIVETTTLDTQGGEARTHVDIKPMPYKSSGQEIPPAKLVTATGRGRTDITYTSDPSFRHRRIESDHISAGNADVSLTYKHSGFSGLVKLESKSSSASGLETLPSGEEWTHYVKEKDGKDTVSISSRGWTGLYF